jgi:hypothetical protein
VRHGQTLPDDRIVEHPERAVAAATTTVLPGGSTIEQRRLLQLAIAERLVVSLNTIRSDGRVLYSKLGVHSRNDAIARATALGLLEQTESPG